MFVHYSFLLNLSDRTFVGLKVNECSELNSYVRAVDRTLEAFNLPVYYEVCNEIFTFVENKNTNKLIVKKI